MPWIKCWKNWIRRRNPENNIERKKREDCAGGHTDSRVGRGVGREEKENVTINSTSMGEVIVVIRFILSLERTMKTKTETGITV